MQLLRFLHAATLGNVTITFTRLSLKKQHPTEFILLTHEWDLMYAELSVSSLYSSQTKPQNVFDTITASLAKTSLALLAVRNAARKPCL